MHRSSTRQSRASRDRRDGILLAPRDDLFRRSGRNDRRGCRTRAPIQCSFTRLVLFVTRIDGSDLRRLSPQRSSCRTPSSATLTFFVPRHPGTPSTRTCRPCHERAHRRANRGSCWRRSLIPKQASARRSLSARHSSRPRPVRFPGRLRLDDRDVRALGVVIPSHFKHQAASPTPLAAVSAVIVSSLYL